MDQKNASLTRELMILQKELESYVYGMRELLSIEKHQ